MSNADDNDKKQLHVILNDDMPIPKFVDDKPLDSRSNVVEVDNNVRFIGITDNQASREILTNRAAMITKRTEFLVKIKCNSMDVHAFFHAQCANAKCAYNEENWFNRGNCCDPYCPIDQSLRRKARNIINELMEAQKNTEKLALIEKRQERYAKECSHKNRKSQKLNHD